MKNKGQLRFIVRMSFQIIIGLLVTLHMQAATFTDSNWISMGGIPGANDYVATVATDVSGNLYVGGAFTMIGNVIASGIAKWDGHLWSKLGTGLNGQVNAIAFSGTDVYAAGTFTTAGGVPARNVAKWDGTNWSALGTGIGGEVIALAIAGSDVYASVYAATNLGKWNGNSWTSIGLNSGSSVSALLVLGGELHMGGDFVSIGDTAVTNVAKWNGSNWVSLGSGVNGAVYSMAASGNDLYVSGAFTTAGSDPANGLAKWNGSSWSALGSGVGGGGPLAVSGSNLYVAGETNIAVWDGINWSGTASGIEGQTIYGLFITTLAAHGTNLFVGGAFGSAGGNPAQFVAKWNGASWSAPASETAGIGGGVTDSVNAVVVLGGNVYAGGAFTTAGGSVARNIAKWNGTHWSSLGSGMNGSVNALAVSGDDLYAVGSFTTTDGIIVNGIAKRNGTNWWALGAGLMGPANGALVVSGGDLYVGGTVTGAGGNAVYGVAKWDGTNWSTLGLGLNAPVYALAISGTNLYAGGNFTVATNSAGATVTVNRIARWNGSAWYALGSGMNAAAFGSGTDVAALAVMGTNLYAGGGFTSAGGNSDIKYLARWNGSSWSAVGPTLLSVASLAISGNDLYAGGIFGIRKWDGTNWSALGSGMNNSVLALSIAGNDLYAGGYFTKVGAKISAHIARARINFTPDNLALEANVPAAHTNTLTFAGVPNYPYIVQYATNLVSSPWLTLSTNAPNANGIGTAIDFAAPDPQRFYRVGYQQ